MPEAEEKLIILWCVVYEVSCWFFFLLLLSVPADIPEALARNIHWTCKALEERRVNNSSVARTFLEDTQVKEEVEKRMRGGDW